MSGYQLYYWPTPNGNKVAIFLEEAGLDYEIVPVHIWAGEQFTPEYLRISPNNKVPALVDPDPADGGAPISLFESGAILLYLAEKTGQFLPADLRGQMEVRQWLFWQVGGQGPMLGQNHHFVHYAKEKIPYAIDRYMREARRLYAVLDIRLEGRDFICGDYSIADMACMPWCKSHERQKIDLDDFPAVKGWFERMMDRPAVQRVYAMAQEMSDNAPPAEDRDKIMFGQDADRLRAAAKG